MIIESRREMSRGPVKGARAIVARAFVADTACRGVYAGPAARRRRRRSSVREDRGIRRGFTPWTRPGVRGAAEQRDACSSRETPVFARFSNKVRHNAPSIRRLRPVWHRQTETSRYGRSFRAVAYSGPCLANTALVACDRRALSIRSPPRDTPDPDHRKHSDCLYMALGTVAMITGYCNCEGETEKVGTARVQYCTVGLHCRQRCPPPQHSTKIAGETTRGAGQDSTLHHLTCSSQMTHQMSHLMLAGAPFSRCLSQDTR